MQRTRDTASIGLVTFKFIDSCPPGSGENTRIRLALPIIIPFPFTCKAPPYRTPSWCRI
jgi:hypothetical protein